RLASGLWRGGPRRDAREGRESEEEHQDHPGHGRGAYQSPLRSSVKAENSSRITSMEPICDPKVLARMRMASDRAEAADQMMQLNLPRRFPDASEAELARRLEDWRLKRGDYKE